MQKLRKSASGERVAQAVRPAVEAALVAAVAFGCAHAGWALLAPSSSNASAGARPTGQGEPLSPSVDFATVQSPFEPFAGEVTDASHAANAVLANLQLQGVRVSTDAARSSAILTLADGAHRAFMVGQDIGDGLRLAEVSGDFVRIAYAGGERRLELPQRQDSFAAALMGLAPVEARPVETNLALAAPSSRSAVEALTPADVTPFTPLAPVDAAAFVAQPEPTGRVSVAPNAMDLGPTPADQPFANTVLSPVGEPLRVPEGMGPLVAAAGLLPGDVIVAINGAAPPSSFTELQSIVLAGPVQVTVRRTFGEVTLNLSAPAP
jgi:type II secretory pathway component PulC